MLERITTGGQTGADQAGWRAAKRMGLATGGWMPMGFRTEGRPDDEGVLGPDESHPEFAELYGARAHESLEYRLRTRANVDEADAVVWFGDPSSRGGRTTLGLARIKNIATLIVERDLDDQPTFTTSECAQWIREQAPGTLLVSGNRESKAPGIGDWVGPYLMEVFRQLGRSEGD